MKKKHLIILLALVSVLGISLYVAAYKEESVLDKIFNKDVEDITYEELQQAKEEHLKMETSSEELDEYEKKLKEIIMEKNELIPKESNNKSEIDILIENVNGYISFLDEGIKYDLTISDEIRNLRKMQSEELKAFLVNVEKKDKSYNYYFSIYEEQGLNYIEKYKVLNNKHFAN